MPSAVDTRRSTPSPPANSAKLRGESSGRRNPVAQEIAVIATGARPSKAHRELFTEETITILVFEDGAVIRLSAGVANGQLLFLTHKESRREVVAQVVRKREFRPTSCYIELKFSESAPGFWGIDFSEETELDPSNAHHQAAAELVETSRTVHDKSNPAAPAPRTEDVDALKREVEALRQQLQSLKKQTLRPNPAAPTAPSARPAVSPAPAAPLKPPALQSGIPLPSGASLSTISAPAEPYPAAVPPTDSFSSVSGPTPDDTLPSLPIEGGETIEFEFEEDVPLPRPEIRVNRTKKSPAEGGNTKVNARGSFRPETIGVAVISAVLMAAALGTAVNLRLIPIPEFARTFALRLAVRSSLPVLPHAAAISKPASMAANISSSAQPTSAPSGSLQPSSLSTSRRPGSAPIYTSKANDSDLRVIDMVPDSTVTPAPAVVKRAVPASRARPLADSEPTAVANSSPITPPKLLKSFPAVASPSDLEYFDKSNSATVVLDGIVDTSGHVNSMRVVSGPASLRAAAMNALQLYEYTPARQNGRAVAAHITVTIRFLFEP